MSKLQESSEALNRPLEEINRIFFLTWAVDHADGIPEANVLLDHPSQSVDCVKTPTLLPSPELSLPELMQRIEALMTISLKDASKAREFLNVLHQPYEFDDGLDRTIIEYVVDEYVAKGRSIAPVMVHAGDGLTDVPRFTAMIKHALAKNYDDLYLENTAEIASPTLKFEDYLEIGVPDILATIGGVYWQPPGYTKTTEIIRSKSGVTQDELDELYEHISGRGVRTLLRDIKKFKDPDTKIVKPGLIVVISPPASRADQKFNKNGDLVSLTVKPVTQQAAKPIQRFDAVWPVTIFNDSTRLGPIIDIPEPQSRETQDEEALQMVEDAMEINVEQINSILGKKSVARYKRSTKRGEIHRQHSSAGQLARRAGSSATRSSVSIRHS